MKVRILLAALIIAALTPTSALAYPVHPSRHSQAVHKAAIIRTLKALHMGRADRRAMVEIGWRESGWNPHCVTGSCLGVYQLQTSYPRSKWENLAWNTRKAVKYVKHRYGTPRKALAHSYRKGWY